MRGEKETGVTLMQMDEGLDSGPVFTSRVVPIEAHEDAGALSQKLADLCAVVVREDLPRAVSGELTAMPQDGALVTLAPPLTREDGIIDWKRSPKELADQVRGLSPRPGAHTTARGKTLKLLEVRPATGIMKPASSALETETAVVVRADKGGIFVRCGGGALELVRGQVEGRKPMSAADLVNGRAVQLGDVLGL
jgi:methionyl-tRNA formyltransferase